MGVFKRDIFALDMICLVAELPGPQAVELNEHMEGWQAFVEAFPAFETNFTLIFSRQAHASRTGAAEHDASGE